METHDLAVAKLVAGREKDELFLAALVRHGLLSEAKLAKRLDETDLESGLRPVVEGRLRRLFRPV